jgi:acyl-homoserine-lactone acylase
VEPVKALTQSYTRTKARNLDGVPEVMELHTNSSNNTVYADADGNIAYLHSNYIPRRDPSFDWTQPVDGSDPRTDYRGLHTLEETPNVPSTRRHRLAFYNANNWPWSAAGPDSPVRERFPAYMEPDLGERARRARPEAAGRRRRLDHRVTHRARVRQWLPAFDAMVPPLVRAFDALPAAAAARPLAAPVEVLRAGITAGA